MNSTAATTELSVAMSELIWRPKSTVGAAAQPFHIIEFSAIHALRYSLYFRDDVIEATPADNGVTYIQVRVID